MRNMHGHSLHYLLCSAMGTHIFCFSWFLFFRVLLLERGMLSVPIGFFLNLFSGISSTCWLPEIEPNLWLYKYGSMGNESENPYLCLPILPGCGFVKSLLRRLNPLSRLSFNSVSESMVYCFLWISINCVVDTDGGGLTECLYEV